jgi:hypothetical protein
LGEPFPVYEKLRKAIPLYNEPDFVAYVVATIPAIRVPDLMHCVMGIFWNQDCNDVSKDSWRVKEKK